MLGYTYQNGIVSFIVNNQIVNSTNIGATLTTSLSTLKFGSESENDFMDIEEYYKGVIDDIGIWNRVLTQDEITNLYYSENTCQSLVINSGKLSSFNPPVYQSTVTIYPNPANDHITIDCGNLANVVGYHIEIVNTLGQVVFNQPMNTQQYNVSLNTWSGTGVYFVKIYDASNNLLNTKKLFYNKDFS